MTSLELVDELQGLSVDDGDLWGRMGEQEVGRGRGEMRCQGQDVGSGWEGRHRRRIESRRRAGHVVEFFALEGLVDVESRVEQLLSRIP